LIILLTVPSTLPSLGLRWRGCWCLFPDVQAGVLDVGAFLYFEDFS